MFNGYHHIGLIVDDGEKSLKFYTKGLGGKLTFSFPMGDSGKTIYLVDLGGNAVVEIIPRGNDGPAANARWAHIAVATEDARKAYALALEAGALSRSEPNDIRLGAMPACNAFVTGPDGEVIEFFQT
ncbi:MAG: VOC family protein [Clostridiales bacterium]|jgi:catechol 2,3-dioxygenase-like lactoylglutathione lyase family enzyme|nr:VOC family protein [Clostridiales bacterium]